MKVSQYMSRPVLTIGPETEFHRAFDLMHSRRIHHLPVVEGDRVVGIVAERDLLLAAANFGSAEVPVGDIMRGPPVCVSENAQLKQAARLLVVNHIGSLPVLSARKVLVGIITETDIFKIAAGTLHARQVTKKTPQKKAAGKIPGKTSKKALKATALRKPKTMRKAVDRGATKRK
ncbi:MAG: CBS domain-containing protein [Acidobacteriota bacterium]